jgi:hypothetical protein
MGVNSSRPVNEGLLGNGSSEDGRLKQGYFQGIVGD